ncbi:MAG: hypothetical protein EHM34_00340 [Nitrosopumilales archaeon]|nr:MAG: hypothetical protein EHM34_00340 [Nitrosopumilales archaeon]
MARRSKDDIAAIESLIQKIMTEENETSPSKIGIILKDKYNKEVSKPTLLSIVSRFKNKKNQQPSDLELEFEDHPEIIKINSRIATLEKDFKSASSVSDRCKISSQIDSAQESKLKMKKTLRETEILTANSNKAQFIIKFGEPTVIKNAKPVFIAGNGQATIDEVVKKKEGEKIDSE